MKELIRILIVEAKPDDADLAKREIRKILSDCKFQVTETREDFIQALEAFQPDVILSDYSLPRFDGMEALKLTLRHAPSIPFIIWTGSIGEDAAVDCIKAGANNFLLKDRVKQLGPAILHALEEKELLVARKQAEQKYQSIFENSMEGIFQSSPRGYYLSLNPAMARLYGYNSPKEMIESIQDIATQVYVEPELRPEFMRLLASHNSIENFEARNYRKDGSIIWTSTSARAVRDQNGDILYYEGFIQDITLRKKAEEALQNNEKRFRALIENGLDDISLLAADGTLLWESPSTIRNLGYAPGAFVGRTMFELIHPDDLEWIREAYIKLFKESGNRQRGMFRLRRADGTWRWVEAVATNMLYDPSVNAIVINYHDITEQKQAEEALRENQAKYQNLVETSHDLIWTIDAQGRLTFVNRAAKDIYGYEPEELIGRLFFDLLDPESYQPHDLEKFNEMIGQADTINGFEIYVRHRDGRQITLSTNLIVLRDEQGHITGISGSSHDITIRKKVEEKLRLSDQILQRVNALVLLADSQGSIRYVSPASKHILGYEPDELMGDDWWKLSRVDQSAAQNEQDYIAQAARGNVTVSTESYERPIIDRWGNTRWISWVDTPGPDDLLIGVGHDITERKRMEEKLRRSESRYRLATKATNDVIWEWYPKTNRVYWSENARHVFGYAEEEIGTDETWWNTRIHQDDRTNILTKLNALIAGNESNWLEEYRFLLKDGSYAYISDRGYVERDETGMPIRMIGAMSNITARKQAEIERQALLEIMQGLANTRDLQELLRLVHDSIAKVIYAENFFVVLHQESTGLFEEIYSVDRYDPPAPPSKLESSITSYVFRSGEPLLLTQSSFDELVAQGEVKLVGTDSASWLGVPLKTSGRTIGVMVVQDYEKDYRYSEHDKDFLASIAAQVALAIERKQAEESLHRSEALYRQAIEVAGAVPYYQTYYDEGKLIHYEFIGEGIRQITGYGPEEFSAKLWDSLVEEINLVDDLAGYSLDEAILRVRTGKNSIWKCEHRIRARDGSLHWVFEAAVELRDENGISYGSIGTYQDITERKRAEQAIREREEQYRTIFEGVQDAIFVESLDGKILMVNQRACEMFGYSQAEFLTKTVADLIPPDEPILTPNRRDFALFAEPREAVNRRANGEVFPIEISARVQIINGEQVLLVVVRDITERKKAETAILESNDRFRTLFEASPDAILLIDPHDDWPIIDCNTAACQMNGYTREELIGQPVGILNLNPSDVQGRGEYLESIRQAGVLHYEEYHKRKDGSVLAVDVSTSLIRFGTRDLILGIDRDVTERKHAEEELRRRAEETAALLGTSMALTNLDLEAVLQTIGSSASSLFLADGCRIFLVEEDGETLRCVLALGENTDAFLNLRIKIGEGVTGAVAASGKAEIVNGMLSDPRAVQVRGTQEEPEAIMFVPLKEGEQTIGILSIRRMGEDRPFQQTDLELLEAFASMAASAVSKARLFQETQRRLAELRASEERFRQLADNIQEAFWMTDAETNREIYMSPAVETIWGRSIQSLMYEPDAFMTSIFSEDRAAVRDAIEKEKKGEKAQVEYRIVRPDGSLRWVWDRAFPIFDESGKIKRIAGISADITERRESELALAKSQNRYRELFDSSPISIWEEDFSLAKKRIDSLLKNGVVDLPKYLSTHPEFVRELASLVKVTDVNNASLELYGANSKETLLQSLRKLFDSVSINHFEGEIIGLMSPLKRFTWEGMDTTLTGRQIEVLVNGSIPSGYEDDWSKVIVSIIDVTERKQTEQQLRKLSRAVEQSGSAILITNTSGDIEYVNPKFTQITGYSAEAAIGQKPSILKSGLTPREEYEQLWGTISSGREWHGEFLNKKKDGTLYWESVTISPILNDRKEITHYVGVQEDITERKQSELETRRHLSELEAVYENGLSVGRLLEPGEIGNRVIETFARYLPWHHVTIRLRKEGSDDLELVSFNLPNLKEEERADTEQHFIARVNKVGQGLSGWVIQTGLPLRTGNVHAHPQYIGTHAAIQSGLYMPLRVGERVIGVISVESEVPNAFTEQDERLLATLANQTAIAFENARLYEAMQKELSERKRVEDALRISESHYRALADSITDILFELDQDLRYTHWNKASEALTGIPVSEAIGKSIEDILGVSEEQTRIKQIYEDVLRQGQPRTFETTLVFNGENRSFETTAYPSVRGVAVVAKDITDRKQTEIIMQKRFELMEYSAKHSLNELMLRAVDEVSDLTGSTIGFFHLMEENQINLGMQTWSTNALQLLQESSMEGIHLPLDRAGIWAEAVRQRRPLIHNDYENLANKKGLPQGHIPILREIVIPIIRNERIMAVMGIANKPQDYTLHDLEVATRLADYAWDITERKQMEVALQLERNQLVQRVEERTADLSRANSNLARALRVKDEFLANMSHELRTPLNAILGLSESLGEQIAGPLNEKQQKYIATISESGHHLLSLINDILDLAKIDAGQITLDINKVDIHSVCQASLRMIKQLAQKKNQEIFLDIDPGLGLMWADERRLKQMIVNLLGNAVKFTPENGKLGLEVRGAKEANQISITVWDNGIGIKQDDLARLFQPFVQLDSGLAREATGTGLGLALVAQMARLHGGSVNAVSEAGNGSRFTIVLPWEPALALDSASRMKITGKFPAIRADEKDKPVILLVEDTKEVVMMLKDYLELAGYRVFTAQDGIDGIVQARHVKPHLILMDIQMPGMDGFETTRKLRSEANFKDTPIIALTALAMPHDRERCLEAGMDEYISKPVNLKALVKLIQGCLDGRGPRTR